MLQLIGFPIHIPTLLKLPESGTVSDKLPITLSAKGKKRFKGFIIQARSGKVTAGLIKFKPK